MNNQTILFITNGSIQSTNGIKYNYHDGIYNNIINGDLFIRWSGQKKNSSTDTLILDRSNIHIWYRDKKDSNQYKYYGKVKNKEIYNTRDNENNLVVDLFIDKVNINIDFGTLADIYDYESNHQHKFTKYKMDCFNKLNLKPIGNWCSGIMEGITI